MSAGRGVICGGTSPCRVSLEQPKHGARLKNVSELPEPGRTRSVHIPESQSAAAESVLERVCWSCGQTAAPLSGQAPWPPVAAGRRGVAQPLAEHRLRFTASLCLLWAEENCPTPSTTPQRPSSREATLMLSPEQEGMEVAHDSWGGSHAWWPQLDLTGSFQTL